MALWKARALTPEQTAEIVEEESEAKILQTEESLFGLEDVNLSEVYSSGVSVPVSCLPSLIPPSAHILHACHSHVHNLLICGSKFAHFADLSLFI